MFSFNLAASQYIMYGVIGVVLVLMILLTIIPQKKRQKQQQEMMNSLTVGTKIMTIGRMVGKIAAVNADNTLVVNVGTEDSPTLIVIDRNAVGLVLENVASAPVAQDEPAVEEQESIVEMDPVEEKSIGEEVAKEFDDIAPVE